MNSAYDIKNGVLYVETDKEKRTERTDAIPSILELENKLEIIESELKDKRKRLKRLGYAKKPNKWKKLIFWTIFTMLIITIVPSLSVYFLENGANPLCDTPLGIMSMTKFVRIVSSMVLIPFYTVLQTVSYFKEKQKNSKREGLEAEINFLEREYHQEKKKLESLKKRHANPKLKDTKRKSLINTAVNYKLDLTNRAELINKLHLYRDYLMKKYKQGRVKDALKRKGFTAKETKESINYIKHNFYLKPRSKSH